MLELFSRLEDLERKKIRGNVAYHFSQDIMETRDNVSSYMDYMKTKFNNEIDTIEGKRTETVNIAK